MTHLVDWEDGTDVEGMGASFMVAWGSGTSRTGLTRGAGEELAWVMGEEFGGGVGDTMGASKELGGSFFLICNSA